ncbi:MAG: YqgE/AlgH family protein [Bacteroidales bacterium]|jgi:putative transcriptional regulator|nr:YqgE/AlgH family protein [Bacteroidales bacterium]
MRDIRKILEISYNNVPPKAGKALLSTPFWDDAYFHRAAILLAEHNSEGTLGFVLDKALERNIGFFCRKIKNFDAPVFVGGPVGQDRMNFIHNKGEIIKNTVPIISNIWLGGDIQEVLDLINAGMITKNDIRFFIGYSGWSSGQLDEELKRNTWLVSSLTSNEIFNEAYENLWQIGVKCLGGNYKHWEKIPPIPEMN